MIPRRQDPYEKINITLPHTWIEALDSLCTYEVSTKNTIVRNAIAEYLEKHYQLLVY